MDHNFTQTSLKDLEPLFDGYLGTLNGVTDGFWESHVLHSEFYQIEADGTSIGYYAVYCENEQRMLTQFYVKEAFIPIAQPIFREVLEKHQIKAAYAPTCDELFLSLCLDHHKKIELQAYFFGSDAQRSVRGPEYERICFSSVPESEYDDMNERTNRFFEDPVSNGGMIYKLCSGGVVLGYGQIIPCELRAEFWDIGMIVLEQHRQKGAGRSLIMHLADICRENGHIPVAGCWYYNHNSKRTLESGGMYTKTRLLHVMF